MSTSPLRALLFWGWFLLHPACGTAKHVEEPRQALRSATPAPSPTPLSRLPTGLYAADEALRDALSGPWRYMGTGLWPGMVRMHACAFRNSRVLVVNVYCTPTETQAFRVEVYSPTRGRMRIYAESDGAVSTHPRREYFTFMAESEPPPGPETRMPPFALTMSFDELRAYDERRYGAFLPACYGGTEHARDQSGCLGALAPRAGEWAERNRAFLAQASDDWYRVVREMRALAAQYGREPE